MGSSDGAHALLIHPRVPEVIATCPAYGVRHLDVFRLSWVAHSRRIAPHYLRRLDRLVADLPDGQRAICTMRYVEGWTVPRIARQVNATADSVRWQLTKIHKHIDATWDRAAG